MKHCLPYLATVLSLAVALPAQAGCFADYKAKREKPLRLHYGVVQITDAACGNKNRAAEEVSARLAGQGWTLLNIVSTFGDKGLEKRKESAGDFFLRF